MLTVTCQTMHTTYMFQTSIVALWVTQTRTIILLVTIQLFGVWHDQVHIQQTAWHCTSHRKGQRHNLKKKKQDWDRRK